MSASSCWSKTRALSLILLLAIGLGACTRKADKSNEPTPVLSDAPRTAYPMPPLKRGMQLSEMGWALPDGKRVTFSSYQNKVLVLDFYATWCAPCRESIPHLIDLQRRYGPQGLEIVGLNVGGPDDRAEVPGFAREFHIQYPLAFPDAALSDVLMSDSDAIPQTFVFDRQGKLIKRYIGYGASTSVELERTIGAALDSRSD